jgi:RimJ/RimL family protein N-acetyltransferase
MIATVRDLRGEEAGLVVDYFLSASSADLARMGIDPAKLPEAAAWSARIREDLARPLGARRWHFVLWQIDGAPIGHSNIGDIEPGKSGLMHLHIWTPERRGRGVGRTLVLASVRRYFEVLALDVIYCQPNAFNVAPNRALHRAGFEYLETYETTPGWLNFHQPVTRWALTRRSFEARAFAEPGARAAGTPE